ncbi:ATP-binding protein [bacterium AH-315-N03]|nr:ATP-binding protein [bacterium AH-315-N03]
MADNTFNDGGFIIAQALDNGPTERPPKQEAARARALVEVMPLVEQAAEALGFDPAEPADELGITADIPDWVIEAKPGFDNDNDRKRIRWCILQFLEPHHDERERKLQARHDLGHRRQLLDNLGPVVLPEDAERIAAGDYDRDADAFVAIRKWGESPATVLVLLGPPGTGKSFAATAWVVGRGPYGGKYIKEAELSRLARQAYGPEVAEFRRLMECRNLVVDEVGEADREHGHALFRQLLDERKALRTILISNMAVKKLLADRGDEKVTQRLEQYGMLRVARKRLRPNLGLFRFKGRQ